MNHPRVPSPKSSISLINLMWLGKCLSSVAIMLEWVAELVLTLLFMSLIIGCGLGLRRRL